MTAREWLNVLAILNSIDEVPGMPVPSMAPPGEGRAYIAAQQRRFRRDPVAYLRGASDAEEIAIWAEVERRLAGGA